MNIEIKKEKVTNKTHKQEVVLGLDLGTAWHGWSLLLKDKENEENNKIIKRGSYWFGTLSDDKTHTKYEKGICGSQRRVRRVLRRRKQRKLDVDNLVKKNQAIFNFNLETVKIDSKYDIYELAVKGLNSSLKPDELYKVLYSKLTFRGSQYNIPMPNSADGKSVSEILLECKNKNNKVRGIGGRLFENYKYDKDTGERFTDTRELTTFAFSRKEHEKDIVKILNNCEFLTKEFKEAYMEIFTRQRKFNEGPGSLKGPSNYGIFGYDEETGEKVQQYENVWDKTVARCPKYKDLEVAYKGCIAGEIANVITQLSFIRINNELITKQQKETIWETLICGETYFNEKSIRRILNLGKEVVLTSIPNGFESFKIFRELNKSGAIKFKDLNEFFHTEKVLKIDELTTRLTSKFLISDAEDDEAKALKYNQDFEGSIDFIKGLDTDNVIENYEAFCDLTKFKLLKDNRWNFSIKALYDYNVANWDQMVTLSKFYKEEIANSNKASYLIINPSDVQNQSPYIYNGFFKNKIFLSPDIQNGLVEALRIINQVLKYCKTNNYYLSNIVVETANDDVFSVTSKKQKEEIQKEQNNNLYLREALQKFCNGDKATIEKLKVLIQSHGFNAKNFKDADYFDVYDGENIQLNDVIANPMGYEVDHVWPISRSADNSAENIVLTKKDNNQSKGNKTPFEWKGFDKKLFTFWMDRFEEKEKETHKNKLFKKLIAEEIPVGFIAKQLQGTANIMRQITDGLRYWTDFQTENNRYFDGIKIDSVSGRTTQKMRSICSLEDKDRSNNEHHSVDASICALIGSLKSFHETSGVYDRIKKYVVYTRKVTDIFDGVNTLKYKKISETIKNVECKISCKKFSKIWSGMKVEDKLEYLWKHNKGTISGETIYGTIDCGKNTHKKEKIKLFPVDFKFETFNKKFKLSWKESACLAERTVFEKLAEIWNDFADENNIKQNPFQIYMNESLKQFPHWEKFVKANQLCVLINNKEIVLSSLTFRDCVVNLEGKVRIGEKSFKDGLANSFVVLIEETYLSKTGDIKTKHYFSRETLLLTLKNKLQNNNNLKALNAWDMGTIFIGSDKELYRLSSFDLSGNRIYLSKIHLIDKPLRSPVANFIKSGLVELNQSFTIL